MWDFKFDNRAISLLILTVLLVLLGNFGLPLYNGLTVFLIEFTQACILLIMALISWLIYANPKINLDSDQRLFWFWTACWWLLLFGRSISWGRDYLPDYPRIYFKIIAASLFILVLSVLLFNGVKREIVRRFKFEKIPFWHTFMAFFYFGLVDIVEHNRIGINLLLADFSRQDLVEEMLEFSVILSLMLVVK